MFNVKYKYLNCGWQLGTQMQRMGERVTRIFSHSAFYSYITVISFSVVFHYCNGKTFLVEYDWLCSFTLV